jgi:hypothetical protein
MSGLYGYCRHLYTWTKTSVISINKSLLGVIVGGQIETLPFLIQYTPPFPVDFKTSGHGTIAKLHLDLFSSSKKFGNWDYWSFRSCVKMATVSIQATHLSPVLMVIYVCTITITPFEGVVPCCYTEVIPGFYGVLWCYILQDTIGAGTTNHSWAPAFIHGV